MTDTTRDAFEAWAISEGLWIGRHIQGDGEYATIELDWRGWQAATLAAQGKRQPLTDEQITQASWKQRDELLDFIYEYGTAAEGVSRRVVAIARAVEAAHGITATPPTGTEQS